MKRVKLVLKLLWTNSCLVSQPYVTVWLIHPSFLHKNRQGLPELPPAKTALEAARNGFSFLRHMQAPDGHWPCEYDGPMFLTPGLVIGSYVTGMEIKREEKLELIRYLFRKAHKEDGGWGLYVLFQAWSL